MDNNKNAGIIIRFFAYLTDRIIGVALFLAPLVFLMGKTHLEFDIFPLVYTIAYIVCALLLGFMISVLYKLVFYPKFGGTLGKIMWGLKLLDQETNTNVSKKVAFYRHLSGYSFSRQIFGLGFWKIIKDDQNLGWHDDLFNTKVVRQGSCWVGVVGLLVLLAVIGFEIALIVGNTFSMFSGFIS